jgi:hypothetical protein
MAGRLAAEWKATQVSEKASFLTHKILQNHLAQSGSRLQELRMK